MCAHTLKDTVCVSLLHLPFGHVPHLFPALSSFSSSPLSTVVLSVTSLCPYNSFLYCRGNKIDAGGR